jgi:hypothetical protein
MAHDPADSRRSLQFDRARRELVLESTPVSQDARKQWLERFSELLAAMFPDADVKMSKPGLATRMFAAEVSIGSRDKVQALDLSRELDDNWRAYTKDLGRVESCCYLDRLDGIWEWAVALEGAFVTGQVRLKNAAFVGSGGREDGGQPHRKPFRPKRPHGEGQGGDTSEGRPYGDRPRPYGDRPRPYGDRPRPHGGRPRPYGGRPGGNDRNRHGGKPYGNRRTDRPYGGRPGRDDQDS